jgi:3-hydroxyacyl-CoA dehydrogenase/enoyl-CoA hydratase/3-hydroxybutyryl-CoA epimerase
MKAEQNQNWHLDIDGDNIAWLRIDRSDSSTNTINQAILNELSEKLTALPGSVKGIIIASNKQSGFIAGADIKQFTEFRSADEAMQLINKGQEVFNQLAALTIPTVAMIQGFCLGGGCELALACRYRIAEDGSKTKIGLPEILLGIHPGWGGTVRLPRLVGALNAMDLILTGRAISAKAAAKIGLVDVAVPERHLERAARYYALEQPKPHEPTALQKATNNPLIRPIIGKVLQKKVAQKASPEHYPAPYAVIENWVREGVDNEQQALKVEAESLGQIAVSDTSRNLVRVFFLQERLKGLGKGTDFVAKRVHVVGAGTMGGDIAAWCALRGLQVTLQDRGPKFIAPAIKRAAELFKKKLKLPRLVQEAMDRLVPDPEGLGVPHADVIIEAIYENLEAKQALFKELEARSKPAAILATNTSSIPLDEINSVLQNPERLVGIHFFNPVAMMQLVEVVQGKVSSQQNVDNAITFVRQIDRLPLPVKSYPGFLVNRVLMPYLMEAMLMVNQGIPGPVIDKAAVAFGMPMGPIELADAVGLDVCLAVAKNLSSHFGGQVPERLVEMVEKGELGRKSGKGFYSYKKGKAIKDKVGADTATHADIAERLILRMLNEAVACLREQVVAGSDLLDAGMIFGTGFAPFRGGPIHYAESRRLETMKTQLQQFEERYGERFKPDAGWDGLIVAEQPHTAA